MGAGQGGVAAEGDLNDRREPAQAVTVPLGMEECRLSLVDLASQGLHPGLVLGARQHANSRRIARKGLLGDEGVDLEVRVGHDAKSMIERAIRWKARGLARI